MREKLKTGYYNSLDEMESDFDLMIKNCLAYNDKDTIFYRAGIRMRDQGGPLFKMVRRELEREGILEKPKVEDSAALDIDKELTELLKETPSEDIVEKMQLLFDKSQLLKKSITEN